MRNPYGPVMPMKGAFRVRLFAFLAARFIRLLAASFVVLDARFLTLFVVGFFLLFAVVSIFFFIASQNTPTQLYQATGKISA